VYHRIKITADRWVDLEVSPRHHLERLRLRAGTPVLAEVKPHVVEGVDGPMEVADLFFEDGTATRGVPFDCFRFVE
jgi:hypothetical protein